MTDPKSRKTVNIAVPVAAATGVVLGVATFTVGLKTGFQLKSLTRELQAYEMILVHMRANNPELVDAAMSTVTTQIEGLIAAAS